MTYEEQLDSKEWQVKRLEILSRDGNICCACGDKRRLEVHHTYYVGKRMAWDYPDNTLYTLCHDCHENHTKNLALNQSQWEVAVGAVIATWRHNQAAHQFNRPKQ